MENQTHKWLAVSIPYWFPDERKIKQFQDCFEQLVKKDIEHYKHEISKIQPVRHDVELLFDNLWIPPRALDPRKNSLPIATILENGIRKRIESVQKALDSEIEGVVLFLNRNILIDYHTDENDARDWFASIVKYPLFGIRTNSRYFMCCYGGDLGGFEDIQRQGATPDFCMGSTTCNSCRTTTIKDCCHTCYWRFINYALRIHPWPVSFTTRDNEANKNEEIEKLLPMKKYKY